MAERRPVGVVIPNLFVRVPVEGAVRAAGGEPFGAGTPEVACEAGCRVVILDLEAAGEDVAVRLRAVTARNVVVLAFGPHVNAAGLAAARAAGAVVLPRGAFLARLPELLEAAFASVDDAG